MFAEKSILLVGWLALVTGLVLPTVLPEVANVSTLVYMALGLLLIATSSKSRAVFRQPAIYLPLLACALLVVALLFTAQSVLHVLAIFVLAPLIFAGSLAAFWSRLGSRLTPTLIGFLALLGTAGAMLVVVFDVFVRGQDRGGWLVNNPIHLADLAVTLGFVALVGVFGSHRWRLLFLLGPLFAVVTAFLTGSRGPILAIAPLAMMAAATIAFLLLPRRYVVPVLIGTVCAMAAIVALLVASGFSARLMSIFDLPSLIASGGGADGSIGERLYMYQSAWNALWASPWYGFGFIDYTYSAAQYAPPGPQWPPSQHLHSDLADFAVIGGGLGLLTYLLFLAAPLVQASKARGKWRQPILYLGVTLPCGYFAMGLTNAMIGILTQTTVYAVVLALIASLAVLSETEKAPAVR
jgi:O-antigen ligase